MQRTFPVVPVEGVGSKILGLVHRLCSGQLQPDTPILRNNISTRGREGGHNVNIIS